MTSRRRGFRPHTQTGQLGRADAAPPLGLEEALDDPVLERVVAQDHEAAARPEQVERRGETRLERVELLVDRDPQGLEDAGRRMRAAPDWRGLGGTTRSTSAASSSAVAIGRDPPRVDDGPRDPRRPGLLAVAPKERGQLGRVERREQLGGGDATRLVSKRMSSGPPVRKPNPRSRSASW